ncbi:MAG: hybrid sensor histidine kinase/response regulator [Desulfobacteraceae bacterium]|nr:MAG: hybrid sensor histidine kinase/response regulator [Desulfobacteraceae bacterium]
MNREFTNEYLQKKIGTLEKEVLSLKNAFITLKESEEKYRQLFEKETDSVMVFDAETSMFEDVNVAALNLFGYSEKEFLGLKAIDIFAGKEKKIKAIQAAIENGAKRNKIFFSRFVKKDGSIFHGAIYAGSFFSKGRVKIFGAVRDITEKKETEEKLRKSQEQLIQAQKLEALGILVAGVAHEINNPINLIMLNVPLLKKVWHDCIPFIEKNAKLNPDIKYGGLTYDFLNENMDQLINDMDMAAKRVESIVSRLKDFARKSSFIDKSEMSINDAVNNSLRLAQSTLTKSKIAVKLNLSAEVPRFKGHLQSIEQIILNLIINAIEAIDHDRGEVIISTGYHKKDDSIYLSVKDNGAGMAQSDLKKIFDPFFTRKQTKGGTGLGLSVSYSLVKAHDGEFLCTSTEGEGSLFTVNLPVAHREKPIKILIADDDRAMQNLIERGLIKERNYIIKKAFNGTEVLVNLGIFLPDLLILDLFMPQMNGLEVCQTLIKEEKLSKMKVLIITGSPESEELKKIQGFGFHNILTKPFNLKDLVKCVDNILFKENL